MKRKRIAVVLFPDIQVLDVTGPVSVFEAADRNLPENLGYDVILVADKRGMIATSGAIQLHADTTFDDLDLSDIDTILIPGGSRATPRAMLDVNIRRLVVEGNEMRLRIASICTGSFILAESGILHKKKCTTHWAEVGKMRAQFQDIEVLEDPIYLKQDNIWISAGVTTGIDMAVAMVAQDFGQCVATEAARDLIISTPRTGRQLQKSDFLTAQVVSDRILEELVIDMKNTPRGNYHVSAMADRCNMSVRNFTRKFKKMYGKTPASMLREIRIAHAQIYLEKPHFDQKKAAQLAGFSSVNVMRKAMKSVRNAMADDQL